MDRDLWERGFDAFFVLDYDAAWDMALNHECDDWFWGFLDAQDYSDGEHQERDDD